MNNKERLETWKRKLNKLENKVQRLNSEKASIINLLNEVKTRQNVKLNSSLRGLDLLEEILHLKDWIRYHENNISKFKNKINVLQTEVSDQEVLEHELQDLEKELPVVEKELPEEPIDVEIPTPTEIEKDVEKEVIKPEPATEIDLKELEVDDVELEKPEFMFAGRQPVREDEREVAAVTRLFDESSETKAVRKEIGELFKDKKDIVRPSRLKQNLVLIRNSTSNIIENVNNKFESAKTSVNNGFESIENKHILYAVSILLLILMTAILFVAKPGITGLVTLTQEKTYTDTLDLVINESGNYTWTTDKVGDISSIKASGKVKGNGTVKIYIERDGEKYLIYDNKANK